MFGREIISESNANQIALTSKKWHDITQSDSFFPRKLLTTHHFIPIIGLFPFLHQNKEGKKRRFIEGESEEESENVRWCEEIGKFGGVFIGGNDSIGYNYHKCS